ncbi:low-density lipoprotein receptor-related protein 8 isoform X2 [Pangasianodon hypophthalmus]|uniref:low-density lipoprotein receptor-related protein 8 isoform X2 n=1 Tax=Pangasianodon hypophthalmus TaxID=310915 RepID=UPI0023071C84|nr:low-density lipoprotein receptor-related protein 8 isoform X2 [Pangasianodon hypophthalmus]
MNESMERFYTLLLLAGLLCATPAAGVESEQKQERPCLSSEFSCSNGQCVDHSWRCDHSEDCEDGSDEENCEENECEVNNGGCSHHCVDQPLGFVCDCPSGMRLVQDTHCEEVEPCLDADVCDQVCVHSNGSFTCACGHGYVMSSESGRCLAAGDAAAVIFSSSEGIMWMKPDGSEQKKIINSTGTSGALTSLTADNTLYWANTEHTHVYRLVLDAGDEEPSVMFSGASGIVGLAVDWINEVLYWTSTGTGAVHAAALNGTRPTPLISGLSSPTAVAVQPLAGFLFWADAGVSPRIERSGLKGQNRKTLVTSAIRHPVSIALDVPRGLLYWADSRLNTVSRVTYDGLHRKTVVESNGYLDQLFGLAVFESGVYWSDRHTGAICHADKHNGNLLKITRISGASSLGGLLVYHRVLQPTVSETTSSPAKPPTMNSDSAFFFSWILSLIVLACVLFAALFRYWKMGKFSSSLSRFPGEPMMKESQDPLVPSSGDPEAHADKDMFPVPV